MKTATPQPIPPSRLATGRVPILLMGCAFLLLLAIRYLDWPVAASRLQRVETGPWSLSLSWLISDRFLLLFALGQFMQILGIYCGHITHALLRLRRLPADISAQDLAIHRATESAALRYRGIRPWLYCYIVIKYWVDPCYAELARRIPATDFLVDLGTGFGQLPVALAERDGRQRALGIEWDDVKAHAGRYAAQDHPGIEIRSGDIWRAELPLCDVITIIDVLHYHEPARQRALLARAAAALAPGGRLLIREIDAGQMRRARWAKLSERVNGFFGWNRGGGFHFRTIDELTGELKELGFTVEPLALDVRMLPGNVLLCAVKR